MTDLGAAALIDFAAGVAVGALAAAAPAYALGMRRGRAELARWLGTQSASRLSSLAATVNQPSTPPPAARPSDKEGPR